MIIHFGEGYSFNTDRDCFVCDICGHTTEDEDELRKHMQDNHGKCLVKQPHSPDR